MSMTVNGYIAKEDDATSFVSPQEWRQFATMVKKVGNLIIGRRTYEVMLKEDEFKKLGKIVVVIVSSHNLVIANPQHHIVSSPQQALQLLKTKGFKTALLGGGAKLNTAFLQEKMVDEIYQRH